MTLTAILTGVPLHISLVIRIYGQVLKVEKIIPVALVLALYGASFSTARAQGRDDGSFGVRPLLTCVAQHDADSFTAVFGYKNDSAEEIRIPIGANNAFRPAPQRRSQPTSFRPGQHAGVFDVEFTRELVWQLGDSIAIASRDAPRCPSECPPGQGADPQGQCFPLEEDTRVIKEEDVHDTGPTFASTEEAISFILDSVRFHDLGDVQVITNGSSNEPVALRGQLTLAGPVFVPHEDGTIEEFEDKFALLLGGRAGFFTVDGEEVCVREDGCEFEEQSLSTSQLLRPRVTSVCNQEFCTTNSSFRNHFGFIVNYCSAGGETKQSSGGYQEDTHWCRKWGFIPWRCTTKRGTNHLTVETFMQASGGETVFRRADRRDVESLTAKTWSIDFGLATPPFECRVNTVCSSHTGSGNSSNRAGQDNRFTRASTGIECPGELIP